MTYSFRLYDIKNKKDESHIWSIDCIDRRIENIHFQLNTTRLVISLRQKRLTLYDLTNRLKKLPDIMTYDDSGTFDLCMDSDNCLLAYPDASSEGSIGITDAYNLQKRFVIPAHDTS